MPPTTSSAWFGPELARYVTKTIAAADLHGSILRVHAGDAVFSPRLAGVVLDRRVGANRPRARSFDDARA